MFEKKLCKKNQVSALSSALWAALRYMENKIGNGDMQSVGVVLFGDDSSEKAKNFKDLVPLQSLNNVNDQTIREFKIASESVINATRSTFVCPMLSQALSVCV
jgi:hypothetical protein